MSGIFKTLPSVTEEQLAALTVTSPFSAALSVPMHTTRGDAWINQPQAVSEQVLISIVPGIRLPVWAIFLVIYPVLGLLFFGCVLPGVPLAVVACGRPRIG